MYRPYDSYMTNPHNNLQWHNNRSINSTQGRFSTSPHYSHTFSGCASINETYSNEYWCETCDRGFRTQSILENHKKQHQKCNIDGCQFIAHPKVITRHIQMQHSTGLYKKIANLTNAEEIEKWRQERRKKYPTKSNIEKKKSEIQEKIDRGEKMGLRKKKEMEVQRNYTKENNKKEHKKLKRHLPTNTPGKRIVPAKIVRFEVNMEGSRGLKPFRGIQQLIESNVVDEYSPHEISNKNDLFEDEDYVEDIPKKECNAQDLQICGALISILNDYGSSDDDIDIIKTSDSIKKDESNREKINPNIKISEEEDSGPEEIKIDKDITKNNTESTRSSVMESKKAENKIKKSDNKNQQANKKKLQRNVPIRRKLPSTLLEKLLSNEIRKERNIILQCIRHVNKNNFFL
ncbi:unnamed protein product [Leptosia nina]|uniref:C2H2-type domain-containing protein n=1 Tax=Leptosia nina TaxID=320188 RepID=A0AAV1JPC5_9NEOP